MRLQNVKRTQDTGDHEEKSYLLGTDHSKSYKGGGVQFLSCRNFFHCQIPCMNFSSRPWHECFLGLIGVHEFFFCTALAPPSHKLLLLSLLLLMVHPLCHWDKMDFKTLQNWFSGLTRYRLKIARHQRILHGRDFVVFAVSYRRIFQSIFFLKIVLFQMY